jgi:hypothetical protein
MKANEGGGGMVTIRDDMKYSGMGNSSMWNVIYFFKFSFVRETDQIVLLSFRSSGFGREMEEEWGRGPLSLAFSL